MRGILRRVIVCCRIGESFEGQMMAHDLQDDVLMPRVGCPFLCEFQRHLIEDCFCSLHALTFEAVTTVFRSKSIMD